MRAAIITAAALSLGGPAFAAWPYNGLAPVASDPATMALAKKAVGTRCRFLADRVGPQVAGFSNVDGVGQTVEPDGMIFVRHRGARRVAFLARDGDGGCRILAVQPLPPAARSERFLQCEVADPDPFVNTPLSRGLGLRQSGRKPLVAYLEADFAHRALIPRDGTDERIRCGEFESGD